MQCGYCEGIFRRAVRPYFQIVQKLHKEMPRLSGSIRVQSGRCKDIPRKAKMGFHLRGLVHLAQPSRYLLKHCPPPMPGNRQRRRTDYQIPPDPPQSSGVLIPQPAPLYPPFHGAGCFCFCKRDHGKSPAVQRCRAFCDTSCYTLARFARTASILSASSEASAPSASPSTTPPRISVGK